VRRCRSLFGSRFGPRYDGGTGWLFIATRVSNLTFLRALVTSQAVALPNRLTMHPRLSPAQVRAPPKLPVTENHRRSLGLPMQPKIDRAVIKVAGLDEEKHVKVRCSSLSSSQPPLATSAPYTRCWFG
jgi:hypothetical protein